MSATLNDKLLPLRKYRKRRKIVIDTQKVISNYVYKEQLADTSDITRKLDIAPSTKREMFHAIHKSVGQYLITPGRHISSNSIGKLFYRNLTLKTEIQPETEVGPDGLLEPLDPELQITSSVSMYLVDINPVNAGYSLAKKKAETFDKLVQGMSKARPKQYPIGRSRKLDTLQMTVKSEFVAFSSPDPTLMTNTKILSLVKTEYSKGERNFPLPQEPECLLPDTTQNITPAPPRDHEHILLNEKGSENIESSQPDSDVEFIKEFRDEIHSDIEEQEEPTIKIEEDENLNEDRFSATEYNYSTEENVASYTVHTVDLPEGVATNPDASLLHFEKSNKDEKFQPGSYYILPTTTATSNIDSFKLVHYTDTDSGEIDKVAMKLEKTDCSEIEDVSVVYIEGESMQKNEICQSENHEMFEDTGIHENGKFYEVTGERDEGIEMNDVILDSEEYEVIEEALTLENSLVQYVETEKGHGQTQTFTDDQSPNFLECQVQSDTVVSQINIETEAQEEVNKISGEDEVIYFATSDNLIAGNGENCNNLHTTTSHPHEFYVYQLP